MLAGEDACGPSTEIHIELVRTNKGYQQNDETLSETYNMDCHPQHSSHRHWKTNSYVHESKPGAVVVRTKTDPRFRN